ncbi:MAG TPA: RES family NAD+ phosphorylase [Solirubrobacteraceae bacterium]|nr:RES family NAD+ phosphorylase [Solirubrobacteraceae bacterium]
MALDIAAVAVRGHWVKHTYPGSPPLPERDPPPDNRWQRGDVVDALYLADSEETAWAEWYRHLAERMIPPLAQMPRELWTWQVDVEAADLSTDEKLAAVGLRPPIPGGSEWPAYQRVGEQIAAEGWAGMLAPSAARPDGKVLCLFRDQHRVRGAEPFPSPRHIAEPPPPPIGLRT